MTPKARLIRLFLRAVLRVFYRVDVIGARHVPAVGALLFVSNHVSYIDPLLVSASTPRPIRFLMWRNFTHGALMRWFAEAMRAIPISADDAPREMVASLHVAREGLKRGEQVGLFAEGSISRVSQILGFKKGVEVLSKDAVASIVPVHIDRMWGSIFSFERGKFFWKRPRQIPYHVTVSFGRLLPPDTPAHRVREAVMELSCVAMARRVHHEKPKRRFTKQARDEWNGLPPSRRVAIRANVMGLQEALPVKRGETVVIGKNKKDPMTLARYWQAMFEGAWVDMAEATPISGYARDEFLVACVNVPDVHVTDTEKQEGHREGTVGRALPGVAVRIVDAGTGRICNPDEPGVLSVKSAALLPGLAGSDGWFLTQDRAVMDKDGFIRLVTF